MSVLVGDRRESNGSLARRCGQAMDMLGQALSFAASVRGKIVIGFVLMAAIMSLLGLAGMNSIGDAGNAVAAYFNQPLASIS